MLEGRILMTGGAGFLGRAMVRRALREEWPCSFTVLSRDDRKHVAMMARYADVRCIRADIACTPLELLAAAFRGHDLVVHMGAVKYVDLAETNVFDTVRVNVHGSENVALAAIAAGVPQVVGISTDKAAKPVNIYGATKMAMERLFIEADRMGTDTRFTLCRYGNVVGSTGSVIPKFKEQLARTGEVLVTDPDMTRFWMGVEEAIDVIVLAAAIAQRGSTVIPIPKAATIMQVVHAAVGVDHARIIGVRPGEKRHEDLLGEEESVRAVRRDLEGLSFYELRPPGEPGDGRVFRLTSEDPEGGLMKAAELAELIRDAEAV